MDDENPNKNETAILACGSFWNAQAYFDQIQGVVATTVGYTGGRTINPTYEQVLSHLTGHAEAIKIEFNPNIIGYRQLLKKFFTMHDPTTRNRQGADIGENYRSAIFYLTDDQETTAREVIGEIENNRTFNDPVVTEVAKAGEFWPAEEFHQKYLEKNPKKD